MTRKQSDDLLAFGYAPGNYTILCIHCRKHVDGCDKGSAACQPCAKTLLQESKDPIHSNDLMHRIALACVASCQCVTKTPQYEFHSLECRYRVLMEASARIGRLERAIATHNVSLEQVCEINQRSDRCDPYISQGRKCSDCPCDNRITLLDF